MNRNTIFTLTATAAAAAAIFSAGACVIETTDPSGVGGAGGTGGGTTTTTTTTANGGAGQGGAAGVGGAGVGGAAQGGSGGGDICDGAPDPITCGTIYNAWVGDSTDDFAQVFDCALDPAYDAFEPLVICACALTTQQPNATEDACPDCCNGGDAATCKNCLAGTCSGEQSTCLSQ